MNTVELLKKLTLCESVSGNETEISELLFEILQTYGKTEKDCMGNIFCTFGEGTHFLLDAHIDEIGFAVKSVTSDGFLKIERCGGIDARMLPASEVTVHGSKEIRGVISTLPPHLIKDEDKKISDITDVSVDIGMDEENAKKIVSVGDKVNFRHNFIGLLNNQYSCSALDDRAGVCAILLALEKIKNVKAKITAMFSVQEELGFRGAKIGSFAKNISECIAVDVSFGYSPLCKKTDCGEMGKGAMVGFSPVLDGNMSRKLCEVAEKNNIPYQKEVMGGSSTGTNADVISVNENGIKTALLSIPEKYMHSPVETVDISDIENTANLIAAYIKERSGEVCA